MMRPRLIAALGFGYLAHGLLKYPAVWMGLILAVFIAAGASLISLWLP